MSAIGSLTGLVAERLHDVRGRIEAVGVDAATVDVVAVTKGFGPDAVAAARAAGLDHLGENYAAELVDKAGADRSTAPVPASWHFLGTVQRNKVARLAPLVWRWEAVDRAGAADAIARRAPGARVMIQVNVAGEPAKQGCAPSDTATLVRHATDAGLVVTGLMTVGPAGDRERSKACFRALAAQARELGLGELSMGMSDDFDLAAGEGATTIRLGRVLFGERPNSGLPRR